MAGTQVTVVGTISIDGGPPQPCVVMGVATPVSSPGVPTHPIALPGDPWWGQDLKPTHPIVIVPPGAIDGAHPEHPIYLPVYPAHPIELPPEEPPSDPGFQWVYTDQYGWVLDPKGGGKPRPIPTPPPAR